MGASASDHADAARFAWEAGRLLLAIRDSGDARDEAGRNAIRREGDRQSHHLLSGLLARDHPADAVLSEEGVDDGRRLRAARVWIVDPLDGTREFGEPTRTDWAVHVALIIDHVSVAGAVALPAVDRVLSTSAPPALAPPSARMRLAVSRTRPPVWSMALAEAMGADVVAMGSAGAKAMAVVLGDADVYAHAGGQFEWDSAAPVAVAVACGLHCSRLDGTPLRYNQPDPWLPDLVICRPELAPDVLGAVGAVEVHG